MNGVELERGDEDAWKEASSSQNTYVHNLISTQESDSLLPFSGSSKPQRDRSLAFFAIAALLLLFCVPVAFRLVPTFGSSTTVNVEQSAGCGTLTDHVGGYVTSGSDRQHAIATLTCIAKEKWHTKLSQQSTSLRSAVREYRRRYNREPPRGFGRWYKWAKEHNVTLIDEYDLIWEHVDPFFAMHPAILRGEMQAVHETLTWATKFFRISQGTMQFEAELEGGHWGHIMRDFLAPIAHLLEDVDILVNFADEARMVVEHEIRERYREVVRDNEILPGPLRAIHGPDDMFSFRVGCPYLSPLALDQDTSTPDFAFLNADPKDELDPCNKTTLRHQHGYFLSTPEVGWRFGCSKRDMLCPGRPLPFAPMLSFTGTAITGDIVVPTSEKSDWVNGVKPEDPISFSAKRISKAGWRGMPFGQANIDPVPWRDGQRPRLHMLTHRKGAGQQEARFFDDETSRVLARRTDVRELNERYLDVAIVNQPLQCGTKCDDMQAWLNQNGAVGFEQPQKFDEYQYAIDVDGNGWSGRFKRLMRSHAVVLKATMVEHWFRDRVQPWYHYVPLRVGYEDLYDIMSFFVGDEQGQYNHEALAESIAEQGREWATYHMSDEECQAYLFRLFLELARVLSDNRAEMDYKPGEEG